MWRFPNHEPIEMNKEIFASFQKICPGFSTELSGFSKEEYEKLKYRGDVLRQPLNSDEVCKLTFPLIFGNFECKIDLDKAEREVLEWIGSAEKKFKNDDIVDILLARKYNAKAHILLGTIYAYKDEYVKSAYHFMVGLKAHSVNIDMVYYDFIQYVSNQLKNLEIQDADYSGCGFDVDNPMGSVGGDFLDARSALEVISDMEGENGEVVIALQDRSRTFGYLVRRGSTMSDKIPEMIDMYQTYVIDKDYNIKRVTIYFNGYFSRLKKRCVRLAKGFKFNRLGRTWLFYNVVE